jgi:predicted metal-dependent hydrolase
MDIRYTVIKRDIKNPRLEFKHGDLFVVVPKRGSFDVAAFIERHQAWIHKHAAYYQTLEKHSDGLEVVPRLSEDFTTLVEKLVNQGSEMLSVTPKRLQYKSLRSRWGSCTSDGIITINLKLRYFPEPLIWYVVFHELVHLLVHAHDKKFYLYLKQAFPDHKQYDKMLAGYEYMLERRKKNLGGRPGPAMLQ